MHECVYSFVKPCTELTCTFIAVLVQLDTMLSHCNHSFLYTLQFSHSVTANSSWPHRLQHASLPCPLPTPGAYLNSSPSYWCIYSTVNFFLWKWSESEIHSVVSSSLQPHGLYSPWNSPGQNTGVGSLSLLQGIFPTQGANPGLSHHGQILYQLNHKGSPNFSFAFIQFIVITSFC